MFLLISRYAKPLDEVDRVLAAHRAYLDELYASGELIASGPMEPRTGGVILTADLPRDRVEAMLANDPFVRENVASYEIVEFHATKQQSWFTALPAGR